MRLVSEWLEYLGQKQILKQGPMKDKRLVSFLCTLDPRQWHFFQFRLYPHSQTHTQDKSCGLGKGWAGSLGLADVNYLLYREWMNNKVYQGK